jgi:hypothetical protein
MNAIRCSDRASIIDGRCLAHVRAVQSIVALERQLYECTGPDTIADDVGKVLQNVVLVLMERALLGCDGRIDATRATHTTIEILLRHATEALARLSGEFGKARESLS